MIKRLVDNRSAVQSVLADRTVTKAQMASKLEIHEYEWKLLEDLSNVLKPLEIATTLLCAGNDSPTSIVRPLIRALIDNHFAVSESNFDEDEYEALEVLYNFKNTIRSSLINRFEMTDSYDDDDAAEFFITTRQIASFLDPQYKDLKAETTKIRPHIRETVKKKVLDLSPSSSRNDESVRLSALDILFKVQDQNNTTEEFNNYLAEPTIDYNFNVFEWWKSHSKKYPT